MKIEMFVFSRDGGDGSFSSYFYPSLSELIADNPELIEDIDLSEDDDENLKNIDYWCSDDPYERGEVSIVTIEIENGKIKPFWISAG